MQRHSDVDVAAEIRRCWPAVADVVAAREGRLTAHLSPEASDADASQAQLTISPVEYQVISPTLLSLTGGRGNLDMGGPPYFVILSDRQRALVLYTLADGHLALSLRARDGLAALANEVLVYLRSLTLVRAGRTGPLAAEFSAQSLTPCPGHEAPWYDWHRGGALASKASEAVRACRTLDPNVRYVAVVERGTLMAMCSRMGPVSESSDMAASDRFEETVVNPAALALTAGGMRVGAWSEPPALIVRYPGLYAVVVPTQAGHITLSVDRDADPAPVAARAMAWVASVASVASMADGAPSGVP